MCARTIDHISALVWEKGAGSQHLELAARGGPTDTGGPLTLGKNSGWLVPRTIGPRVCGLGDYSEGGTNHPPTTGRGGWTCIMFHHSVM